MRHQDIVDIGAALLLVAGLALTGWGAVPRGAEAGTCDLDPGASPLAPPAVFEMSPRTLEQRRREADALLAQQHRDAELERHGMHTDVWAEEDRSAPAAAADLRF